MPPIVFFILGALCYGHASYGMYQRVNSQTADVVDGEVTSLNSFLSLGYLIGLVECICGFVLIVTAFITNNKFFPSRIIDKLSNTSYDASLHTGMGFIHFHHRGVLGDGSKKEKKVAGPQEDILSLD